MNATKPTPPAPRRPGRPRAYDWGAWFGRRAFTLRRGVHYRCADAAMAQQLRNAASHRGVGVRIAAAPGVLAVTVVERMNPEGGGPDAAH